MKRAFAGRGRVLQFGCICLGLSCLARAATAAEVEQFHQVLPLNSAGQLQLDNVNGKIRITAWDRAEVQIDAVKHAKSQEDLNELKIEIEAKPNRIRIHTQMPKQKRRSWDWHLGPSASVDYELKVPARAVLKEIKSVNGSVELSGMLGPVNASTVNGRLAATGLASDAQLSTVNGSVAASFEQFQGVKSVSLKTVNGSAEINLPRNVDATITGESVNGSIKANGGLTAHRKRPVGSELRGKLGNGSAEVQIKTVNGAIRVSCPEGGSQPLPESPA